jgi:hypothetical protein
MTTTPRDTVPPEPSRDLRELAREVTDIQRRLREGDRQFAERRTTYEHLREEVAMVRLDAATHVGTLRLELERRVETVRREMETDRAKQLAGLQAQLEERAPTFSPLRVAAWISGILVPVVGAIWILARFPDRAELRDLENRIRVIEARVTEVVARTAGSAHSTPKTGGTP